MQPRQLDLHHRTRKKIKRIISECRSSQELRTVRRLETILLNDEGYTSGEIAHKLNASRQQVSLWLKTYSESGIEGLYEGERPGRPSALSFGEMETLCGIIDSGPVAYGLDTGVWTSPVIRDVIVEEFGVKYHEGHVRKLLKQFGFSVQRPKRLLALADEQKRREWVEERYPKIKKKRKNPEPR